MSRKDIFIGLKLLAGMILPAVSLAQTMREGVASSQQKAIANARQVNIASDPSPIETRIKETFNGYRSRFIQDKLFVHTDKGTYIPGEIIWFRIYYLDAVFNRRGTLSKIAYLELLDRDNRPVLQEKISLRPGEAMGSMVVPVNLPSGYYRIRAYTRWMKNFSPDLYFEKPILVVNPLEQHPGTPAPAKDGRYDIQFFPEGGNLVEGISSRVGFRVTDAYGKGLECGGLLINGKGDTILKFRPLIFGIGHFDFTPVKGDTYRAVIHFPGGGNTEKNLPDAYAAGYTLSLVRDAAGGIIVKEKVTAALTGKENWLFIHGRSGEGRLIKKQATEGGVEFGISENDLEDGLNQFTLFDESGAPVCERIYFKYPKHPVGVSLATDNMFGTRKKIDLRVSVGATGEKDSSADMSLAIYRIDSLQDIDPADIRNWQWLECETGPVESASWYFNENNKAREEAMDNLLLTQGWRRYAWPVMTADPAITYIPEYNGHLAEGRVVDPVTGKALTGKEVYLSVPSRRTQVSVTTSNNDGKLKFELRNFYGSSEIILQTNLNTDTTSRIEMTDPFSTQYGRWRLPEFKGNFRNSEAMLYRGIYEQAQRVYHHAAYSRFVSEYADTNTFYFVPDEKYMLDDFTRFQTMEEVIREYVVSTNVLLKRNKFQLYLADRPHESFFTDPPLILIDGVPYFDANELFAQDPKKIRRLDLVNREYNLGGQTYYGIISLTTYQGDLQGVQLDPHTTVLDYPGIPDQREFFSPVYETELQVNSRKPDFRTLLFWVPQIQAKADQPIPISFYSSDVPGKYAVVVQGLSGNGLPLTKVSYFEVKK